MSRLANFSGQEVVRILQKHFGFFFVSQKGSHIKVRRNLAHSSITTIVPNHDELAVGTLHGILEQAKIKVDDFLAASGRK